MTIEIPDNGKLKKSPLELDSRLRLLKEFGSIPKIPPERLQAEGLRSFYVEDTGVYSLITEEDYQKRRGECLGLLHNYEGYLFANHLDRIQRFLRGTELITGEMINFIKTRAEKFKQANIPPIFNKEFYTPSVLFYPDLFGEENIEIKKREMLFPNIDFIVQYATGAYDRKRAAIALEFRNKAKREKSGIPIQPATVQDVMDFRRVAFTPEGKISTLLIRETIGYTKKHFIAKTSESTEMHENVDRMVFLFLEEMLKDLKVESMKYQEFDGNIDVVDKPRWYLAFSPGDRIKIANVYFTSINGRPIGKDRSIFANMKVLFPQMAEGVEANFEKMSSKRIEEQLQQAIAEAEANRDFSRVPEQAFVEEPWRDKYLPKLEQFFVETCEDLLVSDPTEFFTNVNGFFEKVSVPRRLLMVPHIRKIFNEFRIRVAKNLTDEQFKQLFTGESGDHRYSGIGSKSQKTPEITELREYLQQRLIELSS